ncbi:MAG TPA: restriction endonuclease [Pseudomonas sp.]|uniref:restriction endonuclease n=1 Tax=Pseudomonas sp. TaxID=306 RepID=UPI002ED97FA1
MAKKTSLINDLFFIAAKLPWWISLVLAIASALYLHSIASAPLPTTVDVRNFGSVLAGGAFRGMATFGQFLVPIIFLGGALASLLARHKRRNLLSSVTTPGGNTLASITWREFELLVGETLRRQGFTVQETGANGPDGGIDLIANKDGEKYLVQCKQWRSVQVGVPVVRELYGAMAAEGAVGGFVITSGQFTKPAREFASGRNLQLVDGAILNKWIAATQKSAPPLSTVLVKERVEPVIEPETVNPPAPEPASQTPAVPQAPACPHCRKQMVIRVARTGANAGGNFWGCSDYPKCRGIRAIFTPMSVK